MSRAANAPIGRTPAPAKLRSLALEHQGLAGRQFGTGLAAAERALNQIGHVQIDNISVVAKTHHHILYNRVAKYDESLPNRLVKAHRAFEYWTHAASYLPMRDYRFVLPMMRRVARGEWDSLRGEWGWSNYGSDKHVRAWVLDRIRAEGPLFTRDFDNPGSRRGSWRHWKPAKRALEHLFMEGELMCIERQGLEKRYELAERSLPPDVDTREPGIVERVDYLIEVALRAHGFATARTVEYISRDDYLYGRADSRLREKVRAGELLAHGSLAEIPFYAPPGTFDRPPKRFPHTVRILSPFDNVVFQRPRAFRVFGFDKIERHVPAQRRRYGYFALPLLYRDRFVGRMDCKAHRAEGLFEIETLYLEDDIPEPFLGAFGSAVVDYAAFTGCQEIAVREVSPRRWLNPIGKLFA